MTIACPICPYVGDEAPCACARLLDGEPCGLAAEIKALRDAARRGQELAANQYTGNLFGSARPRPKKRTLVRYAGAPQKPTYLATGEAP